MRADCAWLMMSPLQIVLFLMALPAAVENTPRISTLEVVTKNAATGDGGNAWGGHQCRIVRTRDGLFTAFTVDGKNEMNREWRLVWRRDGQWQVIAGGVAGREPVNLLASPDGTLHVVGWPDGKACHWSGRPVGGRLTLREEAVPGLSEGNWPYGSAGVDETGRIVALSSEGEKPGAFRWAVRDAKSGGWSSFSANLDYRHCYTYVFADAEGGLSLVSTRDVKWETLGWPTPKGQFDYVFNSYGWWRSKDATYSNLRKIIQMEEAPSKNAPDVTCDAQEDAYLDTKGRMHVVYERRGPSTRGTDEVRYAVFSPDGKLVSDMKIPAVDTVFCRVFQDDRENFWLLSSDGMLYGGGTDAVSFKNKTQLDLRGHEVEYSGFGIAVPRTGTPRKNFIDGVFPSGKGAHWFYFRLLLYGAAEG